jgi:hypothetical protein
MHAETDIVSTTWGRGSIELQSTVSDPLGDLGDLEVLGASLVTGNQVLPWGDVVS